MPEPWLAGPVPGIDPWLMPAAHALLQVREDITTATARLTTDQLWVRPGAVASIGFHMRHVAGSLGRLGAYARGEELSEAQRQAMLREGEPGSPPDNVEVLAGQLHRAVDAALAQLAATPRGTLLDARSVGRARLPSTVLGILFHMAEHAQRHAGQVITTTKIVTSRA